MSTAPVSAAPASDVTDLTVRAIRPLGGFQYAQAGFAVARIGVPGHLPAGPLGVPELARRTGTEAGRLRQLLRVLTSEEVFTLPDDDRVEPGPLGPASAPGTSSSAYELALSWAGTLYGPYAQLHRTLRDGVPGSLELDGIGELVDVGGADGTMLASLGALHPDVRGVVFDLPHVVERATGLLGAHGLSGRITTAGRDFFVAGDLPRGADCYLLSYVLPDWPEQPLPSFAATMDLTMLGVPGARERTADDWERMLDATGFRLDRIAPRRARSP